MTQYLVTIHRPNDYDPATAEDDDVRGDITRLNEAMVAAGARVFVGGLHPVREAISLRRDQDGTVRITDGPYADSEEHVGGLWVLEAASLTEAVEWARLAAIACRAGVEVRAFH